MRVLKLGGSLFHGETLSSWLAMLAGQEALIVVPGGGPFADQVRAAQRRWGFSDARGHEMAVLAMEQYAHMLCGLQSGLAPVRDRTGMRRAWARGRTPVWLPARMLRRAGLPRDWSVSSDSLALWLARHLEADILILVKSGRSRFVDTPAADLSSAGVIDTAFPALWSGDVPGRIFCAGSEQVAQVDGLLRHGQARLASVLA